MEHFHDNKVYYHFSRSQPWNKSPAQGDFPDGSFGLLKNLHSAVNIYKYVQKIIEMHIEHIKVIQR